MKLSLPTPDEILAELGEMVVAQIDARAVSSFEAALDDMTDYHRFLIDAYAADGASLANLEDGWRAIHGRWLPPYRQVLDRAIQALDDEPAFFSTLTYLPHRLLKSHDANVSPEMQRSILQLGSLAVFRLEKRFTRRAQALGLPPKIALDLGGADRSTHEDAVMDFVAAWEGLRHWGDFDREGEPQARWMRARETWALLGEHLQLTADVFVTAVWARDHVGAERFRDMLIRWRDNIGLGAGRIHVFDHGELINCDLLALDWVTARTRLLEDIDTFNDDQITPEGVLLLILENAHQQTLLITAAVLVRWVLADRAGTFALAEARALLDGEVLDEDETRLGHGEDLSRFAVRWRHLTALEMAGSFHSGSAYSAYMDELAQSLDRVSERKVTSGRGYTPSTVHDRQGLHSAFAALLSTAPEPPHETVVAWTHEALNAGGAPWTSGRAKSLKHFLDAMADDPTPAEAMESILSGLGHDDPARNRDAFRGFAQEAKRYAEQRRADQIAAATVNPETLAAIGAVAKSALMSAEIGLFDTYVLKTGEPAPLVFSRAASLDKSSLLEVRSDRDNFAEMVGKSLVSSFPPQPWFAYLKRRRPTRSIRSRPDALAFWAAVLRLAETLDGELGLSLPNVLGSRFLADHPDPVVVNGVERTRDRARHRRGEGYMFSFGRLHVFGHRRDQDELTLFPFAALEAVVIGLGEDDPVPVSLKPHPEGPLRALVEAEVRYQLIWRKLPSYRLRIPEPAFDDP